MEFLMKKYAPFFRYRCHWICLILSLVGCSPSSTEKKILLFHQDFVSADTRLQNPEKTITVAHDPSLVFEDTLKNYNTLILFENTIDELNHRQQRDVERFILAGGVVVGFSLSTNYERKWPWIEQMLTAFRNRSPQFQNGPLSIATADFNHNFIWEQKYGLGSIRLLDSLRSYDIPAIIESIDHIAGVSQNLDYAKVSQTKVPSSDRFSDAILADKLNEPIEFEILNNGDVLVIERGGSVKYYDKVLRVIKTIATLEVNNSESNGLNGLALDPYFDQNHLVYLSYTPADDLFHQHISSFTFSKKEFLLDSEKVIMKVPIDARDGNHAGNALEFDTLGNLYIGMGDFTKEPTGYAAIDEREGHEHSDAQRTAANSDDYRGKILRIHPHLDGSYLIPDNNLFPKDGSKGRPEIYIMGCRNPYRFSIDPVTNHLFWGDVGPDAGKDSLLGPRGYEELNQAGKAGFYGWPYFIGNNLPYRDFNYVTQEFGGFFDPTIPVNNSPNNTGIQQLPPSRPAILWYPYDNTDEFPYMGNGGMNIMVGPLYRFHNFPESEHKLPLYYDGKLLIYDWVRNWIRAVTLDENFQVISVEPFLDAMTFSKPIDMKFGPDGSLYILEYGSMGYVANKDARIRQIKYAKGNRPPQAHIKADKTTGAAPLTINFSADGSFDYDKNDSLEFLWQFSEKKIELGKKVKHVYKEYGIYNPILKVTDQHGASSEARIEIRVGNAPPELSLEVERNQSFYWGLDTLHYQVRVEDQEDGSLNDGRINPDRVKVEFSFVPDKNILSASKAGRILSISKGESLVTESGCLSCHTIDEKSVGPSYHEIAERYSDSETNFDLLTSIVTNGGSGNWPGNFSMPAHPHLTNEQVKNIIAYIFSVKRLDTIKRLPVEGTIVTNQHSSEIGGEYLLKVSYKDKGNDPIEPIEQSHTFVFRHHQVNPATCDDYQGAVLRSGNTAWFMEKSSYLKFSDLDLSGIKRIIYNIKTAVKGELSLRLDTADGPVIGKVGVNGPTEDWQGVNSLVNSTSGLHDLYLVFTSDKSISVTKTKPLLMINNISFELE